MQDGRLAHGSLATWRGTSWRLRVFECTMPKKSWEESLRKIVVRRACARHQARRSADARKKCQWGVHIRQSIQALTLYAHRPRALPTSTPSTNHAWQRGSANRGERMEAPLPQPATIYVIVMLPPRGRHTGSTRPLREWKRIVRCLLERFQGWKGKCYINVYY